MVARLALALLVWSVMPSAANAALTVLCYHDISNDRGQEAYTVSRQAFVTQMEYLYRHGYRPVSLARVMQARRGERALPDKAVLLTFDDGLRSYQEFAVPLLSSYGFPSVVSVVSSWVDGKRVPPEYRGRLLEWSELKRLSRRPLVEIVSHSHDLHHGIPANPQGNSAPAGATRQYLSASRSYETEAAYRNRIHADLAQAVVRFRQELGFAPQAIVWPYGWYNQAASETANRLGMMLSLTLEAGPADPHEPLGHLARTIVLGGWGKETFIDELNFRPLVSLRQRFVRFDLEMFRALTTQQQEERLSRLLDRLQTMQINTVIVVPFGADGRSAFFPSRQLTVSSDVLHRVLHQIRTRLAVRHIYLDVSSTPPVKNIKALYTDLARSTWFNGIVFDARLDQARLSEFAALFRYFRPNARIGIAGSGGLIKSVDFMLWNPARQQDYARLPVLHKQLSEKQIRLLVLIDPRQSPASLNPIIQHHGQALRMSSFDVHARAQHIWPWSNRATDGRGG